MLNEFNIKNHFHVVGFLTFSMQLVFSGKCPWFLLQKGVSTDSLRH